MTNANTLKWTEGNAKLVKSSGDTYRILGYGIPADYNFDNGIFGGANTCPGASACKAVCYAKQGRYVMANVRDARLHNLTAFLTFGANGFAAYAINDLKRLSKRFNVVRVHDSGDFFSQEYLNTWFAIAAALPGVIFYAYTKSHHLDFSAMPANFRIVQSVGGINDELIDFNRSHARIFATHADRIAAGYIDGNINDIPAIEGVNCIGLVYHGVKKLTDAQRNFFK